MQYGYFDDDQREYVITNPKTPVTWINYIGTLDFGGFVNQTGGMLICKGDPAQNRITKYIPQLPASDFKGSTLYIRIATPDGYQLFSPFFVPTLNPYDSYTCHVGLGYTRIVSQMYGLETAVTIFIPHQAHVVIQDIRVTNKREEAIDLDIIPVVEYTHPHALQQFTNADWIPQTMQSKAIKEGQAPTILIQYPFLRQDSHLNFFTSNLPIASFDTDRQQFLGDNGFGTWANPKSLQQPELNNSQALRGDNIGALLHHLGTLAPGESRQLITQLGQAPNLQTIQQIATTYRQPDHVNTALAGIHQFWQNHLQHMQVNTPDKDMNRLLNIHNPRQCYITKNWSRYLSLYQLGLGARGMGFRDSSQDVMGILSHAPAEGKALISKLLHVQKRNGSAMHQFNPLTMIANIGDSQEDEDRPRYYSDDHLWIILATTAYLKETADFDFLQEAIPFYDKDKNEQPIEVGTVWEHLRRALTFTRDDTGKHGLPLLGFADWNDTVNLHTGAESLFTANLYGCALREIIDLATHLGQTDIVAQYQTDYQHMQQLVNQHAWDGAWYIRYFDADGVPMGSQQNTHGQIYTNGQSWPILSGFAPPERAASALESVHTHLNTSNGIKLSTPGFNGYDPSKGGVTTYPPGAKENGGIFLHANPWVMMAETILGNGDRAYAYYKQVDPAARNNRIDEFECEPYVYPQNILGDEHPQFGLARNSWLTGTASWMYQAGTQYILGIRPTYTGLIVNPCIPSHWDSFTVKRVFRGDCYLITVENPDHICQGVSTIQVDGRTITGNIIPHIADGAEHQVVVKLGR